MGWFFRKRVSRGPLALNFSKSGIGISTGVRGMRAGISSHGKFYTSASIPGTGIYYRRYYNHHHSAEPSAFAIGFAVAAMAPYLLLAILLFLLLVTALATLAGFWAAG
jgi:hypothetical protein